MKVSNLDNIGNFKVGTFVYHNILGSFRKKVGTHTPISRASFYQPYRNYNTDIAFQARVEYRDMKNSLKRLKDKWG